MRYTSLLIAHCSLRTAHCSPSTSVARPANGAPPRFTGACISLSLPHLSLPPPSLRVNARERPKPLPTLSKKKQSLAHTPQHRHQRHDRRPCIICRRRDPTQPACQNIARQEIDSTANTGAYHAPARPQTRRFNAVTVAENPPAHPQTPPPHSRSHPHSRSRTTIPPHDHLHSSPPPHPASQPSAHTPSPAPPTTAGLGTLSQNAEHVSKSSRVSTKPSPTTTKTPPCRCSPSLPPLFSSATL